MTRTYETYQANLTAKGRTEAEDLAGITPREALIDTFSHITPVPLRWLWPNRIPLGKLTILAGDPAVGKSMLSIDLAARVSQGGRLPDGEQAADGEVLLISAEDDAADTIHSRLEAATADLDRVHILNGFRRGEKHSDFTLSDVAGLALALDTLEREGRRVVLVVIDPISSYLDGVDSNQNGEVRSVLRPLAALAAKRGIAILGITHFRKGVAASALYKMIGSIAFVAAARAAYAVVRDPEDRERRLFLPVKSNLSPENTGLAFTIDAVEGVPFVYWQNGVIDLAADEVLNDTPQEHHSERQEATEWLGDILAGGPVLVVALRQQARDAGLSWRTLERAKAGLGIVSRKTGTGWVWQVQGAQDRQGRQDTTYGNVGGLGGLDGEGAQEGQECQGAPIGTVGLLGPLDGEAS